MTMLIWTLGDTWKTQTQAKPSVDPETSTWFMVTAVWTLAATASTRALILNKLMD